MFDGIGGDISYTPKPGDNCAIYETCTINNFFKENGLSGCEDIKTCSIDDKVFNSSVCLDRCSYAQQVHDARASIAYAKMAELELELSQKPENFIRQAIKGLPKAQFNSISFSSETD